MTHPLVMEAERLSEGLLWPDAPAVDRAERVPAAHLSALAGAGLFGIEAAGDLPAEDRWLIIELLAAGCMSTAFVWIQHHTAVRALMATHNVELRDGLLADLLAGRSRAGIAIGGVRPPAPSLIAAATHGGWSLTGTVPWVTGWSVIDVVLTGAATEDGREVWALLPAGDGTGLTSQRQRLVAADASCTVRLVFDRVFVSDGLVTSIEPAHDLDPDDPGLRSNASLALGVTRRAAALIGPSAIDAALQSVRRRLDEADRLGDAPALAKARAAAAALALRAAAALTVHTGSRAVDADGPSQRLAREAQFTAVFGTRPAIKSELLSLLER